MKLKAGDRVDLHIRDNDVVGPYESDYDSIKTFEIIAIGSVGHYLYVPRFLFLKSSKIVTDNLIKLFNIDRKFQLENCIYIQEAMIASINYIMDGCICSKCKEFIFWANDNEEEFTCYGCKQSPYRNKLR